MDINTAEDLLLTKMLEVYIAIVHRFVFGVPNCAITSCHVVLIAAHGKMQYAYVH